VVKKDIVEWIYRRHGGISRKEAQAYVDTLLDLVRQSISVDGSLLISGFGKFTVKSKASRPIVLPNGKRHQTQNGHRVRFAPSGKLKSAINGAEAPGEDIA